MRTPSLVSIAMLLFPAGGAFAQGHVLGPLCDGQIVVTGTVANRGMTGGIARDNPAMAQAAALVARVEPEQQPQAQDLARTYLRRLGLYNDEIFALLLMDARQGRQAAQGTAAVVGAVGGGLMGMLTGKAVGAVTGTGDGVSGLVGAVGVGKGASFAQRLLVGEAVTITLDTEVVEPVLTDLFRHPCEISAADALARLQAG